jgi:sugar lactone lactonase YvrE
MWTVIGDGRDQVGESPVWDAERNALWWVDTWGRTVNRHILDRPETERFAFHEMVGGIALAADGSIRVFGETGMFHLDPATRAFRFLSAPPDLPATHRFNDVTVDPRGRLIAGTMRKSQLGAEPTGVLYVVDGAEWRRLFDGFWTLNGLAFSPDGRTLHVSDSHPSTRTIWRADYSPATGAVSPRQTFVDMSAFAGRPDGAAVDAQGGYWIAGVGGGCLYRFDPSGRVTHQHDMPVERPTKLAFGGPGLDRIFVTSMSVNLERPDEWNLAGALLQSDLAVSGLGISLAGV